MKTITKKELKERIKLHKKWLNNEDEGIRLVLVNLNLSNSNLRHSDLRYSDLSGSDLSGSDLSYSDLRYSDLSYSDLRYSDLRYSDLSDSDLSDSDLSGSNLRGSNLSGSDLSGSDLRGSDLTGANIDFSCWPLWCGSLGVKLDKEQKRQLGYHFADTLDNNDPEERAIKEILRSFVNKFHRVIDRSCKEIK